jgi:hypothetical protein
MGRAFGHALQPQRSINRARAQGDLHQLAQSRCSPSINQRPNQEGLVYVAHAHLVFKEVDQFFVFHSGATMVVLFPESVATDSVYTS